MNQELAQLEAELAEVRACDLEYLPNYGYSSKNDIIREIELDIEEVKAEMAANGFDYTDEELEYARTRLCRILGLPRFC